MKSQVLTVLVALSPLAAGAGVMTWMYHDEGGVMALFGHSWLDDYPTFLVDENPCPGFRDLRNKVPDLLVVMVQGADGRDVPPEAIPILQEAADEALPHLEIIVAPYGRTPNAAGGTIAILHLHVVVDGTIETWDGTKVNGFYCKGHIVQSVFLEHEAFTQAVFLHEFGHYLGLCHDDGTWMRASMGPFGIPGHQQHWSAEQIQVLRAWDEPGQRAPSPCLHG